MIPIFLRFDNRNAALAALSFGVRTTLDGAQFLAADGWFARDDAAPIYFNLSEIGVISKRTGGTDDAPIYTSLPGWHVNALWGDDLATLPEAVSAARIAPATPSVVFG